MGHTGCPDNAWVTWCYVSFQIKYDKFTSKKLWTIAPLGLEKCQVSGANIYAGNFWWFIKMTF